MSSGSSIPLPFCASVGRTQRAFAAWAAAALMAVLALAPQAFSQVADIPAKTSPLSRLLFVRAGSFEVWQDTSRLGTEFYRIFITPDRDSLLVSGHVVYELKRGRGTTHYEKHTLAILRALDNYLALYQTHEDIGGQSRALALAVHDTSVSIFHEAMGKGEGNVIALPPGRVYLLDPSVYEQVEFLARDFMESALPARSLNALIPARDTVIAIRLTRGPKESVTSPEGKKIEAQRIDLFDDLTLVQAWLDGRGNMVQLAAPAQKVLVRRLAPGKDEAEALSESAGPADTVRASARR